MAEGLHKMYQLIYRKNIKAYINYILNYMVNQETFLDFLNSLKQ